MNWIESKQSNGVKEKKTTSSEKSKGEKRQTQTLEDAELISVNLLHCLFKHQGCKHKGFKMEKWLQRHIKKNHSDREDLSLEESQEKSPSLSKTTKRGSKKNKVNQRRERKILTRKKKEKGLLNIVTIRKKKEKIDVELQWVYMRVLIGGFLL